MPDDKTKIMTDISKTPRLYTETRLAADGQAELNAGQAHYLKSVLRMDTGEHIRAFNPTDGEWVATITDLSKKSATIAPKEQTRTPTEVVPLPSPPPHATAKLNAARATTREDRPSPYDKSMAALNHTPP